MTSPRESQHPTKNEITYKIIGRAKHPEKEDKYLRKENNTESNFAALQTA